jgi:hypothetical protein
MPTIYNTKKYDVIPSSFESYIIKINERLYSSVIAFGIYPDGSINIIKNRNGEIGEINIDTAIDYFSKILAGAKLKDTHLDMFKEGLSQLLREAIIKTLKGDFSNDRELCSKSTINGF